MARLFDRRRRRRKGEVADQHEAWTRVAVCHRSRAWTKTEIELPLGHYTMARNPYRKVFIATGTGLAPFLPMFRQLEREGALGHAELYFGCRTAADDHHAPFRSDARVGRSVRQPRGATAGRI